MIISHKKKFIYVHVSRTGGSSTKTALGKYADLSILSGSLPQKKLDMLWEKYRIGAHSRPPAIKKYVGEDVWNSYFKFVVVRNPYSWAVSRWAYNNRRNTQAIKMISKARDAAKESFYAWLLDFSTRYYKKHLEDGIICSGGWMSSYAFSEDGKQLVDFVGRFENLPKPFMFACKKLGIKETFPHIRPTNWKRSYREYYSDKARDLADSMFYRDLKVLHYKF